MFFSLLALYYKINEVNGVGLIPAGGPVVNRDSRVFWGLVGLTRALK